MSLAGVGVEVEVGIEFGVEVVVEVVVEVGVEVEVVVGVGVGVGVEVEVVVGVGVEIEVGVDVEVEVSCRRLIMYYILAGAGILALMCLSACAVKTRLRDRHKLTFDGMAKRKIKRVGI